MYSTVECCLNKMSAGQTCLMLVPLLVDNSSRDKPLPRVIYASPFISSRWCVQRLTSGTQRVSTLEQTTQRFFFLNFVYLSAVARPTVGVTLKCIEKRKD